MAAKIDPDWLEDQDSRNKASCTVCQMVLQVPTTACPEGHALCRECYVSELSHRRRCPLCQHPTDTTRLQRCRPLEDFIGDLRMRCKHGKEAEEEGVGEGGAAPRAKRARLEPPQSVSTADLREELGLQGLDKEGERGELVALLEEHRRGEAGGGFCSWKGKVSEFAAHLTVCEREEVQCPYPGCEERVVRAEVGKHMAASGEAHMRRAWGKVTEMEETVVELQTKVAGQGETIARQNIVNAGLQRRVQALTRVFTWSTDRAWSHAQSLPYTFTDGVYGFCCNSDAVDPNFTHFMGFQLEEGPVCKMHYRCSILDTNDKVLRLVSEPEDDDFQKPPTETAEVGSGTGASFSLTAANFAGAVRADGSIKLRFVVHLYLPE